MDLEQIQSIIDTNPNSVDVDMNKIHIEERVARTRAQFQLALDLAKKRNCECVQFIVDLCNMAHQIWFEWMTEVEGYVVMTIFVMKPINKWIFTRVTKEMIGIAKYHGPMWVRFFPKGTTKEMIERMHRNVERVDW